MIKSLYKNSLVLILVLLCCTLPKANAQYSHDTTGITALLKTGELAEQTSPDSAALIYKSALTESENIYYINGVKNSIHHLYTLCTDKGLFDTLINALQNALVVCSKSKQLLPVLPNIYNDMGNLYKLQSKYELAMNYYLRAIALIEHTPSTNIAASVYNNLGAILMTFERDSEALYYLNKAEQEAKRTDNYSVLGFAWTNKGVIYMYQKDWKQSEYYFQSAIMLTSKYKLIPVERFALVSMGDMYTERNMPNEALAYLKQALSLTGDVNPYYQNLALRNIGLAYFQLSDYEKAKHYLLDALDVAKKYNLVKGVADTHQLLSDIYSKQGDYKEAYDHLQSSFTLERDIQSKDVRQNLNQLEVKYRSAQKDKEILENRLQISQQENHLRKKNVWIGGISAASLLLIVLFVSWYRINTHKQQGQKKQIHILEQQQEILEREKEISQQEQDIAQLNAMMQGEEKERTRIARELHDGIVSQLLAAKLNVNMLRNRQDGSIDPEELESVLCQLDDATKDLRKTAHNLIPDILLQEGLATAVLVFCEKIEKSIGLEINFQSYGTTPRFESYVELTIYRMVQELLQNVIKHAKATLALVQLSYGNNLLSLTIEDNGIGFVLDQAIKNGTGLNNIISRVRTLNGRIDIVSNIDAGTTIDLEFNLKPIENNTEYAYKNSYSR
jgi:signal transduction histidine kinase/Tfp pilus assembly protein PilF